MTEGICRLLGPQVVAAVFSLPTPAAIGVGLAAVLITLVVWIVHRLLRKSERVREMEHVERLQSIEAGLPWHCNPATGSEEAGNLQRSQMHNAFWIAFWLIAVGVSGPFHAVSALFMAESDRDAQLAIAALISAGAASVTASICAVVVVLCSRPKAEGSNKTGSASARNA